MSLLTRRRKFAASQQKKLQKNLEAILTELGAVPSKPELGWCQSLYTWQLSTKAGLMGIAFHEGDSFFYVHCRFVEPEKAIALGISCNPHSGKWNFHCDRNQAKDLPIVLRHAWGSLL